MKKHLTLVGLFVISLGSQVNAAIFYVESVAKVPVDVEFNSEAGWGLDFSLTPQNRQINKKVTTADVNEENDDYPDMLKITYKYPYYGKTKTWIYNDSSNPILKKLYPLEKGQIYYLLIGDNGCAISINKDKAVTLKTNITPKEDYAPGTNRGVMEQV